MEKYHYVGLFFKLWKGSRGPTFKIWGGRGPWVPLLTLREVSGPGVLVPILHHAHGNISISLKLCRKKHYWGKRDTFLMVFEIYLWNDISITFSHNVNLISINYHAYNTSHKFWDRSPFPHYQCCLQVSETVSWHRFLATLPIYCNIE